MPGVFMSTTNIESPACLAASWSVNRPRVLFRPTRPQQAAGMRMEPPPSLALAAGTMPEATAAAAPPEEPPGLWSGFQGLCVGP